MVNTVYNGRGEYTGNKPLRYLLLLSLLLSPLLQAQSPMGEMDENYKGMGSEHKWQEQELGSLPDYPHERDLRELSTRADQMRYFVDIRSIMPGKDNVVRLNVVLQSDSGARTVFYEGYDCGFRRYKRYAYAGPAGPLQAIENPEWQRADDRVQNRFRQELIDNYLCDKFAYAASRRDIIRRFEDQADTNY